MVWGVGCLGCDGMLFCREVVLPAGGFPVWPGRFEGCDLVMKNEEHVREGEGEAPAVAPPLSLEVLAGVLGEPKRWRILRELAKESPLPVGELARRVRIKPGLVSKHLLYLRNRKMVRRVYGRLYELSPGFRPVDGVLDLGHCVIRVEG